jgi:hypothetical protein
VDLDAFGDGAIDDAVLSAWYLQADGEQDS